MLYKVAIIGAGDWSQNHLTGWRAQPDVSVEWVVRSTEEGARQKAEQWGVPHWSASYKEVLERKDIDIADIVLPHDLHAEVACYALERGKHVVMEKPIARTLEEARRIAEGAHRHQRTVMISENWDYSTMVQKAHAAIVNGEIGAPFLARSSLDLDVGPSFAGRTWCRSQARMGGGALIDAGIHCVSACRYLLGEVREVSALTANHGFPEIAPMEDTAALLMRFESGATGVISCSYIAKRERPRSEFAIFGSKGTIEFDTHARPFFLARGKQRCEQFDMQPSRGFVEQMAHFLECLREHRTPITSPEEQIGSLAVVLAAYRSAESGCAVRVADVQG